MADIVRSFNNLPRPQTTPTGLKSHWVFGVRHVSLNPPGDHVIVVHPPSQFVLQGGPGQILSTSTPTERAKVLVPLLLEAFIDMASAAAVGASSFAPWTWASEDSELAKAVEGRLKQLGVTQGLCHVTVCSAHEQGILEGKWSELRDMLMTTAGQAPVPTGTLPTSSAATVSASVPDPIEGSTTKGSCSKCKTSDVEVSPCESCDILYCSRSCLIRDWKMHKKKCARNRVNPPLPDGMAPASSASVASEQLSSTPCAPDRPSGSGQVDAHTYYNTTARVAADAQALLRSLRLTVHPPGAPFQGYHQPLTHLVYTGRDTPGNMQVLFGPDWRASLGDHHKQVRMEILLNPPRGSPIWTMNQGLFTSSLVRSPRPATDAEQQEITRVRELEEMMRRNFSLG